MKFPNIQVIDHSCGPELTKITSQSINDHAFIFSAIHHLPNPHVLVRTTNSGVLISFGKDDCCELHIDVEPSEYVVAHIKTEMNISQFIIVQIDPDREKIEWIAPKWKAVVILSTLNWNMEWLNSRNIKSIGEVYLYDSNSRTYCCELTPSYELHYADSFVQLNKETDNDDRDAIEYEVRESCFTDDSVIYMHCRTVDKIENEWHRDIDSAEQQVNAVISEYHANPYW